MVQSRCAWVTEDPLSIQYHDNEWGRLDQFENDYYLFEKLSLEGAQAGLSWMTILKRREAYRAAFEQFDPQKVAAFDEANEENLLQNDGIIRNKQKIRSAVNNARAFLNVQDDFGSFHAFLWQFAGGTQKITEWNTHAEIRTHKSHST